jgi:hypothetical protein
MSPKLPSRYSEDAGEKELGRWLQGLYFRNRSGKLSKAKIKKTEEHPRFPGWDWFKQTTLEYMTKASNDIENYLDEVGKEKLDEKDISDLVDFLEKNYERKMNRPLFVTRGKGGGQKWRMKYMIEHDNENTPCYFYFEDEKTTNEFIELGHLPLQAWIEGIE